MQSDAGQEFVPQRFQRVLKENGINYKPLRSSDVKALVAKNLTKLRGPKYDVSDLLRISRLENVFEKGYVFEWTTELFKIDRVSSTRQPVIYYLNDSEGEK